MMAMIGVRQAKILHELGYRATDEDGAILQHDLMCSTDRYVWQDESFRDVIERCHW